MLCLQGSTTRSHPSGRALVTSASAIPLSRSASCQIRFHDLAQIVQSLVRDHHGHKVPHRASSFPITRRNRVQEPNLLLLRDRRILQHLTQLRAGGVTCAMKSATAASHPRAKVQLLLRQPPSPARAHTADPLTAISSALPYRPSTAAQNPVNQHCRSVSAEIVQPLRTAWSIASSAACAAGRDALP